MSKTIKATKKEDDWLGAGNDDDIVEDAKQKEDGQKPKKEDDDDPDPLTLKRKPKKEKEDSIADLRKARDELRSQLDEANKKLGDTSKISNEALKPIVEYIEGKYGKLDEESISKYIEHNKTRKTKARELEDKLKEKDSKLKDLDIRASDEFAENFKAPYEARVSDLLAEVAMVDKDGKIIQEGLFKSVVANIAGAKEITSANAKAVLQQLGAKYKELTGEDYNSPTVSAFMSAIREVRTAADKMEHAYNNWEEVSKESKTKSQAEQQREQEQASKQKASERRKLAQKAVDSFNYEDYEVVATEDEIVDLIEAEFKRGEKLFAGEEEAKPYDFYLVRGTKAELFDKIYPEYKKLKELYESDDNDERDEVRGRQKVKAGKGANDDVDWLKAR